MMNTLIDAYLPVFLAGFSLPALAQTAGADYALFRELCLSPLAQAARAVETAGYAPAICDAAFFAVVVWFDERVLCSSLPVAEEWRRHLLQTQFFQTTTGGELFFEKLALLEKEDETTDNQALCALCAFCLLLGFQGGGGKYTTRRVPESFSSKKEITRFFSPGQVSFMTRSPGEGAPDGIFKKKRIFWRNGNVITGLILLFIGMFYFCYSGLY
ncbi:TPA: DotU family type IV/VI secretion system protein [Salmonella enterica]|uniref:DotU family type IV/VI secretion system protein n=1 Tax=Salmonella enterica TaxID=28901 RepID=A0A747SQ45_SALER|nr:DotU family type IV/VI secretion system protein [Salmonella enterica]HAF4697582.1 DotU family type IV/VI secretion system protein [Salmonella enterica]